MITKEKFEKTMEYVLFVVVLNSSNGEILYSQKIYSVDFEKKINMALKNQMIVITYYNRNVIKSIKIQHIYVYS